MSAIVNIVSFTASVTTYQVVTLAVRQQFSSIKKGSRHPIGMARLLPKKIKRELVIREGSFWILIVSSRGQLRPLC